MKYPIGIQSFEKIRREGYVYVDKTELVYQMVSRGSYYFLSRPRRFGKSLLLSTLDAYFSGKRELFKGLAIEGLEKDWKAYPILRIDLNTEKYDAPEKLDGVLDRNLSLWEELYGSRAYERTFGGRFEGIIRRAFQQTGKPVVILVDEYDKPLLQAISNPDLLDDYCKTLKGFYGAVKSMDEYIKFAFFTGVTKFSKVNVFSDLNNLEDISLNKRYATVCGVSETELHEIFDEEVGNLAEACGMTKPDCYAKMKKNYDGYHFSANSIGMYNPFSMLNTLANREFKDYWFETGTPSFLVELLQKTDYHLEYLQEERVTADVLNNIDVMAEDAIPIIYQSGYLTIHGYDERFKKFILGFPNKEVENGFINFLAPYYTRMRRTRAEFSIERFIDDVESGNAEKFMDRVKAFFSDGDYRIAGDAELYFQNALYILMKMMGFYVEVERPTSWGRMDMLVKTARYVYVMEFKINKTAEEALQQIIDKQYAAPFAASDRKVYLIGVNFSTVTRTVDDYKISTNE